MSEDVMLQEAIEAFSEGQKLRARDLLTRLLRANQNNPEYWIWMSALVDTPKERIYCLESALRIDPTNSTALRGLVVLGGRRPPPVEPPAVFTRRKWWSGSAEELETSNNRLAKIISHPAFKVISFIGVGLVVVALILVGIFGLRGALRPNASIVRVTLPAWTPVPASSTPSMMPTNTLVVRSPTPTFIGPTPLWMLLDATYTPYPVYISTPHGVSEAYSAGMRAYRRGDYPAMLGFMQQASQVDPNAPDLYYYIGEAYRLQGDNPNALKAYQQAVKANPNFAPGYLGLAQMAMLTKGSNDIQTNLDKAIRLDPNFADAYLVYAAYQIQQGDGKLALDQLKKAEELAPYLPGIYVYRAQADLQIGLKTEALQSAEQANELDSTLLPAYLALAQAHFALGNYDKAQSFINTYLQFITDDVQAWMTSGQINLALGKDYQHAQEDFTQALSLDSKLVDAYYYRGQTYLLAGLGQKAVNDFAAALQFNSRSFDYNLGFGHALFLAGRALDAYHALQTAEKLAQDDEQRAGVYYWEALALEQIGNPNAAIATWKALLALPEEAVSQDWINSAHSHLLTLNPPTRTQTPTATRVTLTPTGTATLQATPTKTGTPSASRTSTPTPLYR